jgi:flavin reductase (DIM6/NTAB) family NADH-FMN oxidoreductase RutF
MADGGIDMFTEFTPNSDNTKMLRKAFSRFATGVTIVSCDSIDGHIGMTVNSFSSISLNPALIMWAPDKRSSRFKYFEKAHYFAIHVLNFDQQALCNEFVKNKKAFDTFSHSISSKGVPIIDNCLARFHCVKYDMHDAGDHKIIIGKVESAIECTGNALSFFSGEFGEIKPKGINR